MANPTPYQINRHRAKLLILANFSHVGIGGIMLHPRIHANAHPEVMLCTNEVAQFGLYLARNGEVRYFIRAIGTDPVLVQKILGLSNGLNCKRFIIENNKNSRNVLVMTISNTQWWALSAQDLKAINSGCVQMKQVFTQI